MLETGLVGLAKYAARGKQYLVLVRPFGKQGIVLHQLHYADEVKAFSEVPIKEGKPGTPAELKLAVQLIQQIAQPHFDPQSSADEVKGRILALIQQKVDGQDITAPAPAATQAQVMDLMDALRKSLGLGDSAAAG